jgi:hypothetical protein
MRVGSGKRSLPRSPRLIGPIGLRDPESLRSFRVAICAADNPWLHLLSRRVGCREIHSIGPSRLGPGLLNFRRLGEMRRPRRMILSAQWTSQSQPDTGAENDYKQLRETAVREITWLSPRRLHPKMRANYSLSPRSPTLQAPDPGYKSCPDSNEQQKRKTPQQPT